MAYFQPSTWEGMHRELLPYMFGSKSRAIAPFLQKNQTVRNEYNEYAIQQPVTADELKKYIEEYVITGRPVNIARWFILDEGEGYFSGLAKKGIQVLFEVNYEEMVNGTWLEYGDDNGFIKVDIEYISLDFDKAEFDQDFQIDLHTWGTIMHRRGVPYDIIKVHMLGKLDKIMTNPDMPGVYADLIANNMVLSEYDDTTVYHLDMFESLEGKVLIPETVEVQVQNLYEHLRKHILSL